MLDRLLTEIGVNAEYLNKIKDIKEGDGAEEVLHEIISEIKNDFKNIYLQDQAVIDYFKNQYGGMAIGKEKQLKKQLAKKAGLALTSEEVETMPYEQIVEQFIKGSKTTEPSNEYGELSSKYNEAIEQIDALKAAHKEEIEAVKSEAAKNKERAAVIDTLEAYIPTVIQVDAANVKAFVKAYMLEMATDGVEIRRTEKNEPALYVGDLFYTKDGRKVTIRESITSYYEEKAKIFGHVFQRNNTGSQRSSDMSGLTPEQKKVLEINQRRNQKHLV